METIAVYCSWADAQLLSKPNLTKELPPELLSIVRHQSGLEYLNALSSALLLPQCTDSLFLLYEPVTLDLLARASDQVENVTDTIELLCAATRLLPYNPSLKGFVQDLFMSDADPYLGFLSNPADFRLASFGSTVLQSLLLALFRLFSFDLDTFRTGIAPVLLSSLCRHEDMPTRYLANRCLAMYMQMTDAASQDLLRLNLQNGPLKGQWEDKDIDYRFLSLYEEKRWDELTNAIMHTRQDRLAAVKPPAKDMNITVLSPKITVLGEVLLLRQANLAPSPSSLVSTRTTIHNLTQVGQALLSDGPIVLIGVAGSGKTSLLREAARAQNKLSSMVTLYLNEQTDAKSLLGLYTTTPQGGSFTWQPGVLTQAVKDGRWVLIENLDRASSEAMSILIPIIEHGELLIPSRREKVRASPGFKILATVRTRSNVSRESTGTTSSILGGRLWQSVPVAPLDINDVRSIVLQLFSKLRPHSDMILHILERVRSLEKSLKAQSDGLRETLRWCRRMQTRLEMAKIHTSDGTILGSLYDDFLLDAVDCYAGAIPPGKDRDTVISIIAEELQCSPQRLEYLLHDRRPEISDLPSQIKIGKEALPKPAHNRNNKTRLQPFAKTQHFRALIESVVACVRHSEPTLLVGETGIGKTAVLQYLATLTRQQMTVINVSQQSESADLIGGFKPVSVRSIILPLAEDFDILFDDTFSSRRNEAFLASIQKSVVKNNWHRLLLLWDEAVRMAEDTIKRKLALQEQSPNEQTDKPAKRRRIDVAKFVGLRTRWMEFTERTKNLRARVSGKDHRFAFSFVEGRLVTALRRGDWVLLDEINLATSETLEAISSVLNHGADGPPSILLSDAGHVDHIVGNSNFRVFASMNPSTDIGKRELPAALRTKLTELFVDAPDRVLHDLIALIETYVGPLLTSDRRAGPDLAQLYLDAKNMAEKNLLSDGAGQKPHFSVRSLVRSLLYVTDHAPIYGLRRAIYEGFSMSFMTVLSIESEERLLVVLDRRILGNHRNARSTLSQTPRPPTKSDNFVQFRHYWVAKGASEPVSQPHYVVTPFVERNLLNLARATSMKRFPILLQGPTSSGKTSMIEYLANISGNKFVRINNHEHTDLQEYLGSYTSGSDGKLHYKDGVLVDAIRHGKWVVLDELNLAPTDVLEALNRLLDDNRELLVPETQEIIRPHPRFMLFATQNPAGLYGGRKHLSRAFRNRFLELHFDDIPETELETILRERSRIAPSYCAKIVAVYKKLSLLRQSSKIFEQRHSFVTLRDLFRWALRSAENKQELAQNGFMLLGERVRDPTERKAVKDIIEDVFRVAINETELYAACSPDNAIEATTSSLTWTPAMRRLYGLVSKALDNNEPVLLIGETGCGKTQLCQAIAQAHQKKLKIVNAHSNTEAGDLLGAQRPVRQRALTERLLIDDLKTVLILSGRQEHLLNVDLESLLELFKSLSDTFLESLDGNVLSRIRNNTTKVASFFEWVDGSLTDAMKEGLYFLLDEIALADDSVLERLNSVLEPSRTLFLAEKGTTDSEVIAAKGFQFMATMNPGGDHGKRELSAALRNRLTEIWVPDLTEDQDIVPILHERLRSFPKAPKVMVAFAKWFHGRFYGTSRCQISLRDLLSWADFINQQLEAEILQSIIQGAFLVYIDALGADPAGSISILSSQIADVRAECLAYLNQLLGYEATHLYGQGRPQITLREEYLQIGPYSVPRRANGNKNSTFHFEAPTTLENAMRILRALQVSKPILIEGNPGVGKTAIVQALADTLGKSLTRMNLSEQTDLMDLFGSDIPQEGGSAGRFAWQDGPFLKAMQSGGWVLLDEMNLASQSILEGLNSCIDHRQEVYVAELGQNFRRHPDFVLFAAQNSHHHVGGRKGLPLSFVNRFTVVYADILNFDDLEVISRSSFPNIPSETIAQVVRFATTYNTYLERKRSFEHSFSVTDLNLRDISRWLALCQSGNRGLSPRHYLDTVLSQRLRAADQKEEVARLWQSTFQEEKHHHSYYHNITRGHYQVGLGFMRRAMPSSCHIPDGLDMTLKSLPVQESLILCIEHKWPVILAGSSGCGKSSLLRALASIRGTTLMELALSRDTDSIDLIGGFEQLDYDRLIQEALNKILGVIQHDIVSNLSKLVDEDVQQLLQLYHLAVERKATKQIARDLLQLSKADPALQLCTQDLEKLVRQAESANDVTFQWVDGMLIDAMESGKWVILDNANLCNPSVLDRLNSLLEFGGYLVVNEQHTTNNGERIIRPHPDFRIFLTVDPRHGELSRAMRNRSVELYMGDNYFQDAPFRTPKYFSEAEVSRIRFYEHMKWTGAMSQSKQAMLNAAMEIIAPIDVSHGSRLTIPDNDDWNRFDIYKRLMHKMYSPHTADQSVKILSGKDRIPIEILTEEQPARTLVNEPLLQLRTGEMVSKAQRNHHWLQGKYVELLMADNCLRDSEITAQSLENSQMTVLQRSIASLRIGKHGREASSPIAQFLSEILRLMHEFLPTLPNLLSALPQPSLDEVDYLLNWIERMVYVTGQKSIEEAHLRTYVDLGYQGFINLKQLLPDIAPSPDRVHSRILGALSLSSGQGLQRMWPYWRPRTASDAVRTKAYCTIERVATCIEASFSTMVLDLEKAVNYRLALEDACRKVLDDKPIDVREIDALGSLIDNIKQLPAEKEQGTLRPSMELLCQFRDAQNLGLTRNPPDSEKNQKVLTLAGRPIDLLGEYGLASFVPSTLSSIAGFAGWKNNLPVTSVPDRSASLQMLHDIEKVYLQPISAFQSLDAELRTFGRALSIQTASISADNMKAIREGTHKILEAIVDCHSDFTSIVCSEDSISSSIKIKNDVSEDHYFPMVVHKYLEPALRFLRQSNTQSSDKLLSGAALFSTSLAALHLLVPDKLFDPAVQAIVKKELHNSRSEKFKVQLAGLKAFEELFSGQTTNLRCRLVEEDIERMGTEPSSPPVFRPASSELNNIQNEFSNILHSVLRKDPEIFLRQGLNAGEEARSFVDQRRQEYESLRRNVQIASLRLGKSSNYQDLAIPVMRTLQCLELGARLIVLSEQAQTEFEGALLRLSDAIPLAGAKPNPMLHAMPMRSYIDLYDVNCTSTYDLIVQVADFVLRPQTASSISNLMNIFQKSYEQWKYHLERDQALAAKRSKFYRYRGEEEDDDNAAEDMQRLFPDFTGIHERKANGSSYSPRVAAVRLAAAHELLFEGKSNILENLLSTSLDSMTNLLSRSALETNSLSDDRFLSLVYLRLKRTTDYMSGRTGQDPVDVYTNPNVTEARNLVELVHSIRERFRYINDTWPEHATPRDVLHCCSNILAVKINDPIMKMLLKIEKLHAIMSEWQKVASSQFSVALLLEKVKSLIINWRKLEMLSWAKLLEAEDRHARDEAMSWWFLLYEIIIAIPQQATESNDFEDHIIEMTATLNDFIGYSPIGQYETRMNMLTRFSWLLQNRESKTTQSAVSNVLKYHDRGISRVSEFVRDRKVQLARDIKEQITLASWKDTNVVALRESAKRSHHKLFRIVKKYRALISQPVSDIMTNTEAPSVKQENNTIINHAHKFRRSPDTSILNLCEATIANWESRPGRLRDFDGAARSMGQLYQRSSPVLNLAEELEHFCVDFTETTDQLRKETPETLTDNNSQTVTQLKARKRRFLADTLRGLREMGLPNNLNSRELGRQSTIAKVLATIADFDSKTTALQEADNFYYAFLDTLSTIRTASRQHNEELTSTDVTRGCGFSEGLLYVLRRQRNALSVALHSIQLVESVIAQIAHLRSSWSEVSFQCLAPQSMSHEARLAHALQWLPGLLHLSCSIVTTQQTFSEGELDFTSVTAALEHHARVIQHEREAFNNERSRRHMPLRSSAELSRTEKAVTRLTELRQDLESWSCSQPQLGYLLKQIIPWTDLEAYPDDFSEDLETKMSNGLPPNQLEYIDHNVSNVVDKVFVSMQQVSQVGKDVASSTEDTRWFMSSESSTAGQLKALHMEEIHLEWKNVLSGLGHVQKSDLQPSIALCILTLPVLEQYLSICRNLIERFAATHKATSRLSFVLGQTFSQVLADGFCSPLNSTTEREGEEDKVEMGTGLGEGKGAEDISKDVDEDEDLSEFAAQEKTELEGEEIDAEENAVDMGREDLEGDIDENGALEEADYEAGDGGRDNEDNEIDEETGSVDNLDPAAVDEKLWEGLAKEDEKELENENVKGTGPKEQSDRQHSEQQKLQDNQDTDDADEEVTDGEDTVPEEMVNEHESIDQMDPHMQQEKQIDLPDEMQLDGNKDENEDSVSDDMLDELSSVDEEHEEEGNSQRQDIDELATEEDLPDPEPDALMEEVTQGEEDGIAEEEDDVDAFSKDHTAEQKEDTSLVVDPDDVLQGDSGTGGEVLGERENPDVSNSASSDNNPNAPQNLEQQDAIAGSGTHDARPEGTSATAGRAHSTEARKQEETFKKLGDILEQWHRQTREIFPSSDEHDPLPTDVEMTDVDFEHVKDEGDRGETQALGAGSKDEARELDESKAIEDPDTQPIEDQQMHDAGTKYQPPPPPPEDIKTSEEMQQTASVRDINHGAFIPNRDQPLDGTSAPTEELLDPLADEQLPIPPPTDLPTPPASNTHPSLGQLWPHYSALTHTPSLQLSNRLRLLLPPTTATKLRGDYRTGKRLNMKRIIPFIASGYRRDKIWLRRTLPSKRNYQIVLAVDDSGSMLEGPPASTAVEGAPRGVAGKALEALALVAKGLSALDIGDNLAIIAFGGSSSPTKAMDAPSSSTTTATATATATSGTTLEGGRGVRIAHSFGTPFTDSAGPSVFAHFTFRQSETDVVGLVKHCVAMFRDARQSMPTSSGAGEETWQLAIVVGDGIFDHHEEVKRLVRGAAEERIAFVYVVVDSQGSANGSGGGEGGGEGGQSILDLQRATFDTSIGGGGDAGGKLVMKPYLETFPFGFYVVVREVGELGSVLCEVLRGWFGEVGGGV